MPFPITGKKKIVKIIAFAKQANGFYRVFAYSADKGQQTVSKYGPAA